MASTMTEKQGWLGDLETKSIAELQELLIRQEKLLKNDKFIQRLPDKGSKIKEMAERLKSTLSKKDEVDEASDMFQRMAVSADDLRTTRSTCQNNQEKLGNSVLREIVNVETTEKMIEDHREPVNPTQSSIDYHKKIILKAEENPIKEHTFKPGKSIKHSHIEEIPPDTLDRLKPHSSHKISEQKNVEINQNQDTKTNSSITKHNPIHMSQDPKIDCEQSDVVKKTSSKTSRLKYEYDANLMSAAIYRDPKCPSQVISIKESIRLLEEQKKKQEEIQAKQAAAKLMEGLNTKMVSFDPEGARKMAYRVQEPEDSDEDSDCNDDKEMDYPD